jgi:hypothetical protein
MRWPCSGLSTSYYDVAETLDELRKKRPDLNFSQGYNRSTYWYLTDPIER